MLFLSHHPGPPLNQFVDHFWLVVGGQTPRKESILPSGTIEMVINLRDDEVRIHDSAQPKLYKQHAGAVVSGTYSKPFICDAMQHEEMMGVHFKPGGAFPFLGASANELTNAHTDLADLWGPAALELRERLCSVTIARKRFRVMEDVLNGRLRRAPKLHLAAQIALHTFETTGASIRSVTREVGLCPRRFVQVFSAQVGLTPKLFCRLLRFQRARVLAERTRILDWAQLASACGYFDQSHLIKDFREFSGFSPMSYLKQHQQDGRLKENHLPLLS